jgi:hypothetical protein
VELYSLHESVYIQQVLENVASRQLEEFLLLSPNKIQSNLVELDVRQQVFPPVYSDAVHLSNYQVVGWNCLVVELYSLHESVYIQQVVETVDSRQHEDFHFLSPTQIQSNLVDLDVPNQVFPSVYSDAVPLPKYQVVGRPCIVAELYSLHESVYIQQLVETVGSRKCLGFFFLLSPTQIQSKLKKQGRGLEEFWKSNHCYPGESDSRLWMKNEETQWRSEKGIRDSTMTIVRPSWSVVGKIFELVMGLC